MGDNKSAVLAELASYEMRLGQIESRFKKTANGIWIGESDAQLLLQYVNELIALLNTVLGVPNRYSRQISAYYSEGLRNMLGSPSLQSVRDLTATVKAVQTYVVRRSTEIESHEPNPNGDMEHDVMEVCVNGHKVTGFLKSDPLSHETFCKVCGAKTVSACPCCSKPIKGDRATIVGTIALPVPHYCVNCGEAYPWQNAGIQNLKEIVREGGLAAQDLNDLDRVIPDLVSDTPRTESASLKAKRILGKLGRPIYEIAIKVATDIASETAKKTLGLG